MTNLWEDPGAGAGGLGGSTSALPAEVLSLLLLPPRPMLPSSGGLCEVLKPPGTVFVRWPLLFWRKQGNSAAKVDFHPRLPSVLLQAFAEHMVCKKHPFSVRSRQILSISGWVTFRASLNSLIDGFPSLSIAGKHMVLPPQQCCGCFFDYFFSLVCFACVVVGFLLFVCFVGLYCLFPFFSRSETEGKYFLPPLNLGQVAFWGWHDFIFAKLLHAV